MKKKLMQLAVLGLVCAFMAPVAANAQNAKTAVIYFSQGGNTEKVAKKVAELTKADIYKIEVEKPYPADRKALDPVVKAEQDSKKWPAIKKIDVDLSKYNNILIGSPVWNAAPSNPVMAFLAAADFGGKNVITFGTCDGGEGKFFEEFAKNVKNGKVTKGSMFIKVADDKTIDKKIGDWVKKLKL